MKCHLHLVASFFKVNAGIAPAISPLSSVIDAEHHWIIQGSADFRSEHRAKPLLLGSQLLQIAITETYNAWIVWQKNQTSVDAEDELKMKL